MSQAAEAAVVEGVAPTMKAARSWMEVEAVAYLYQKKGDGHRIGRSSCQACRPAPERAFRCPLALLALSFPALDLRLRHCPLARLPLHPQESNRPVIQGLLRGLTQGLRWEWPWALLAHENLARRCLADDSLCLAPQSYLLHRRDLSLVHAPPDLRLAYTLLHFFSRLSFSLVWNWDRSWRFPPPHLLFLHHRALLESPSALHPL